MKVLAFLMFVVLTLCSSAFAQDSQNAVVSKNIQDVCEGVDEKLISKHINIPSFQIAGKRSAYFLCEVVINAEGDYLPLYVSRDSDFVILGEMFSSRVHISRESVLKHEQKAFETNKELLDKAVAFTYTPEGEVRDHLYFITDPQCPHCENAKKKVKEIADNRKLEIRVLFFPINSLSRDKAIKGICTKMTYQDYLENKYYVGTSCPEGLEKMEASMKAGRKLKIGGVPTFVTSKGLILEGFNAEGLSSL